MRSLIGKTFNKEHLSTVGAQTATLEVDRSEATNWSEKRHACNSAARMAKLIKRQKVGTQGSSNQSHGGTCDEQMLEEVAKQLTEEMVSTCDKQIIFSLWDCGGQQVFYSLLHVLFTRYGVYAIVYDMREILNARTQAEALDAIGFWLHSIQLQAPGAPVLLAGTSL